MTADGGDLRLEADDGFVHHRRMERVRGVQAAAVDAFPRARLHERVHGRGGA